MADRGKRDKGKREEQKKAKRTPAEKRKAKQDKKNIELEMARKLQVAQIDLDAAKKEAEGRLAKGKSEAEVIQRQNEAEIAALRVPFGRGDFGLAALPGEIFVELGCELEAASPFSSTRTLGLTNGSMGYIPTREAYEQGGYEAGHRSARYDPDTGHRWAEAAARLLRACGE